MRFFPPATLVALATLVCLSSGFAQDGAVRPPVSVPKAAAPAPNGTNVAVIDIVHIFNNHIRFKAQTKQLDAEKEVIYAWMQDRQKALQIMKEGIKDFKVGNADFQKYEEKYANEATAYQLEASRKQQDVAQREAAIYYEAYVELEKAVALCAQRNRIGIVLRCEREPIKRDDGNSIRRALGKPVVYQTGLDISNFILTELNKGQTAEPATPGPASPGPRTANPSKTGPTKSR